MVTKISYYSFPTKAILKSFALFHVDKFDIFKQNGISDALFFVSLQDE